MHTLFHSILLNTEDVGENEEKFFYEKMIIIHKWSQSSVALNSRFLFCHAVNGFVSTISCSKRHTMSNRLTSVTVATSPNSKVCSFLHTDNILHLTRKQNTTGVRSGDVGGARKSPSPIHLSGNWRTLFPKSAIRSILPEPCVTRQLWDCVLF